MDDLLKMMNNEDAAVRVQGVNRLADEYFERCVPVPELAADGLIEILRSDPSVAVRLAALARISADFEWWGDSPVGSVKLDLLARIRSALPIALGTAAEEDLIRVVGEIIGRLGSVRDFLSIPEPIRGSHAFKSSLLDGLSRRELYGESESLLQLFLRDPDAHLRRRAEDLLDDN